jgi:hypothetical protein
MTAVGYRALYSNTTGPENIAMGFNALRSNTTGGYNISIGNYASYNITTSSENSAIGYSTMFSNSTGANNSAFGSNALYAMTTGNANVAIGRNSLPALTTAEQNVGVGNSTLESLTTGFYNLSCGHRTGRTLTTGSYNVYLGSYANASSAGVAYEINIQANSADTAGKGGSTGLINAGGGGIYNGTNSATWAVTSDRRLKKNIVDNNTGLDKITAIQVRNFEYRVAEEITELPQNQAVQKTGVQLGVIAQELQAILPDCVKTETTGVMSINSDNLTWYMINAIKELKAEFDAYKASHP